MMNKEEILEKSRNENRNKDIYELEIVRKAQRTGGQVGITVAFVLMLVERMIMDRMNYSYFLIILATGAGLFIYKAVKLKKKHEILVAAAYVALVVYAAVMVIRGYIG